MRFRNPVPLDISTRDVTMSRLFDFVTYRCPSDNFATGDFANHRSSPDGEVYVAKRKRTTTKQRKDTIDAL